MLWFCAIKLWKIERLCRCLYHFYLRINFLFGSGLRIPALWHKFYLRLIWSNDSISGFYDNIYFSIVAEIWTGLGVLNRSVSLINLSIRDMFKLIKKRKEKQGRVVLPVIFKDKDAKKSRHTNICFLSISFIFKHFLFTSNTSSVLPSKYKNVPLFILEERKMKNTS